MPTLDWNIKKCLKKCSPISTTMPQTQILIKKQLKRADVTFEEITHAYEIIANIVSDYGDRYLPIFERLHREINKLKLKNELLDLASEISLKKLSTNNPPS